MAPSSCIFRQAASALSRSGHVIQENAIDSSSAASTARWKSVSLPCGTSTPQVSTMRVAP